MASDSLIDGLERQAAVIRRHVMEVATEHVCHIAGALSAADIMTALYFHVLKLDPADPPSGGTATTSSPARGTPSSPSTPLWPSAASCPSRR